MKRLFTFCLLACCTLQLLAQGQTKHVLFVGNSYTEVNDLPMLVSQMAASMGDTLTYDSNTPGGCTFNQHCTNQSMNMIQQGGWDVVVLQEQSQYPSFPQSQVEAEVFPYAAQLVQSVYMYSPCAEPMFFMTWGRQNGDQQNAQFFPVLGTYEGMDSMLYERYMYMASVNDASVCPVGRVWRVLRSEHPEINLYSSDGSHPSMAGSYAAACAFYTMIFRNSPLQSTYCSTLDENVASIIRSTVDSVVYQQLPMWQRPLPEAGFDTVCLDVTENSVIYRFANTSSYTDTYFWDFGDGETSNIMDPVHVYTESGTYTVTLVATRHCMDDTVSLTMTVTLPTPPVDTTGISVASTVTMKLYPNPAHDVLVVESESSADAVIVDMVGRKMQTIKVVEGITPVDLRGLPRGRYFLLVDGHGMPFVIE